MPIIETRGALSSRGYGQFAQSAAAPTAGAFIEDVFSTTLYTGTGAAQSIANRIALGAGATSAGWFASIFGSTTNSANGVAVDSTGNAYVCGTTIASSPFTAATLTKFSPTGAVIWQTSLPSTIESSIFESIKIGPSGDVYACGIATVSGGFAVYLVVKYNSSGVLQWQRTLSITGTSPRSYAIDVDSSDFVYVTGQTNSGTFITTVKFNSSGSVQWQVRYPGEGGSVGNGIAVDASGNVHVVGTEGYTSGEDFFYRAVILKYNSSGTLLWSVGIGQSSDGSFSGWSCALDSSGNVYATVHGETLSSTILCKLNSSGALQWQTRYSTSASQRAVLVTTSSGDSYIGVGTGGSLNNGFVAKFNTSGDIQWQRRIQTNVFNRPDAIALSGSDSLWVVGDISTTVSSAFAARLPVDGSGTGAYTLNGQTLSYVVGSELSTSVTRLGNTAGTSSAGNLISNTSTFTNTPTFLATALTPLPQGAGLGGLVWIKGRSGATDHALYDTVRGATFDLASNTTAAQTTQAQGVTAFLGSGFSIGSLAKLNTSAAIYAAWTFARQPKFFDVITWTGDGTSTKTVPHNLGAQPGLIIWKDTGSAVNWRVTVRRSDGSYSNLYLNLTNAGSNINSATAALGMSATTFNVGYWNENIESGANVNGQNYVAYLFAHNAGGFGASGTDNAISCGSFTSNSSDIATVELGWEPQFVLMKPTSTTGNWWIADNLRGFTVSDERYLLANSAGAEASATNMRLTNTGFTQNGTTGAESTYIYIAIRRGPMRTPTSGTSVFTPTVYTGTNVNNRLVNTSIAPDMVWMRQRNDTVLAGMVVGDRLRGQPYFLTGTDAVEVTSATAFDQQLVSAAEYGTAFSAMNGVWVGTNATAKLNVNTTANNHIAEAFRRAPGFFDVVCYTGTGSATTVAHNLGVAPELIIVKSRGIVADAQVYASTIGASNYLVLSGAAASTSNANRWNNTAPTASVFTVGTNTAVNGSGSTYVAYLFSSVNGVSKVGTYTGTGATLQVDCGFTAGARLVLIKRTNATGSWYIWDSARGIVAGNDPYLVLNFPAAAEVTSTDWVDTLATGFEVSNAGSNLVNVNGGTYIFLAIA